LYDGTKVDGPVSLRKALVARSDLFVRSFTVKLLTYALGRGVEYYDMPTVRSIEQDSAKNNYRFSSLVLGVVKSAPFQMSRAEAVVAENNNPAAPATVMHEAASKTVAGRTPRESTVR
jgi:membrane carboxypeptidase/penicillin-binding protein